MTLTANQIFEINQSWQGHGIQIGRTLEVQPEHFNGVKKKALFMSGVEREYYDCFKMIEKESMTKQRSYE